MTPQDEINITHNGVSVKTVKTKTLYDAQGNPVQVPEGNHRQAVGIGDYDNPEDFQAAVAALIEPVLGEPLANPVAMIARIQGERDQAQQALAAEKQSHQADLERLQQAQAELTQLRGKRNESND